MAQSTFTAGLGPYLDDLLHDEGIIAMAKRDARAPMIVALHEVRMHVFRMRVKKLISHEEYMEASGFLGCPEGIRLPGDKPHPLQPIP